MRRRISAWSSAGDRPLRRGTASGSGLIGGPGLRVRRPRADRVHRPGRGDVRRLAVLDERVLVIAEERWRLDEARCLALLRLGVFLVAASPAVERLADAEA